MDNQTNNDTKVLDVKSRILNQEDLYSILPFGKTKIQALIHSGELPLVKVGRDYMTTFNTLEKWIEKNVGTEIYY